MRELILILAVCGVGFDLFSLPLALCTMVVASGVVQSDARFLWLGSWWMIGVAWVLLCFEWGTVRLLTWMETTDSDGTKVPKSTADEAHLSDRSVPVQVWHAVGAAQHVLSAGVSTVVVFALGAGLDPGARLGVLVAAWAGTGTLRVVKGWLRRNKEEED